METKRLNFSTTLKEAISIGLKNAPSVIAAVVLWLITIWVPYINVGTTIAMGEYFITMGLMVFPILIGVLFMIVPAIVLSIAWTLSYYFLIEKGKNPIQAIKASNDATYGSKWIMFAVKLVVGIIAGILLAIFQALCDAIDVEFITYVVMFVLYVLIISIDMAVNASFWKQLKDNVE